MNAEKHCTYNSLIRQEEWRNAKPHYIRIGKIGNIARMLNPKNRSGPVACSSYPTKPGKPSKKARNDEERVKASILTHNAWMSDPHGKKKCHFIDILAITEEGQVVAVQVTSKSNMGARIKKIADSEAVKYVRKAGWKIFVWGTYKQNNRWQVKEVDVS